MTFYSGLAAVATNLLTSKGQLLTFSKKTTSVFDPTKGKNNTTISTFTGHGAAFDYNKSEIDGEVVRRDDIRLIFEATTTVPAVGDTTTIDGVVYRVMRVKSTSPARTVVMYELQLRK